MSADPDTAVSALARLKDLLLGDERERLARHEEDLERLAARDESLVERLPELIDRARERDPERLQRALATPVAEALGTAVEERKQLIVDVLFPVIGPAIRKAIAEALRTLAADFNRALESSFTARGLRWRIESWRTGVPYAQVVLKHTLRYRIDHLFLIEAESGLVIHREDAPDLGELDSDAIAGMLTAIQQFVRDSVGGSGTLDTASVGEHLLWVESGPRANLACFLRGVPTETLRLTLRKRLERIHERLDDPMQSLRAAAADTGAFLSQQMRLEGIDADARAEASDTGPKPSPWPLRIAVLVIVALFAWWSWRAMQWRSEVAAFRATLENWPGLVVQRLSSERGAAITVRALLDPLAEPPPRELATAAFARVPVMWHTRGYVSLDAPIVVRRAAQALTPPAGVTIELVDGTLRASGVASAEWRDAASSRALLVPGVGAVDFTALTGTATGPTPREVLERTLGDTRVLRVEFLRETEPAAGDAGLEALTTALRDADAQARALGLHLSVRTFGSNDETGAESVNATLRDARAAWLAERLREALPDLDVAAATAVATEDPRIRLDSRSARVDVQIKEAP